MEYNKLIDHTALKPDVTPEAIVLLCEEAKKYGFASVCVNPGFVRLATHELKGSSVKVCTVIGFPLGATLTNVKVYETQEAVFEGATEIDMVINISQLKAKNYPYLLKEISEIKAACHGNLLKVIIETCLLTDEEKVKICQIAVQAGADYVKTSTGFSTGGATVHDVSLMRKTVGPNIGVKASGGIRTHEDLVAMVEAGASRIGTSAGPKII
ncbi:MAG: deoxyribose-phosphate aldolase [Firmicutes bacterium]|nr:deoxyribose-phosphate aldolase [Bacillota bacterium]